MRKTRKLVAILFIMLCIPFSVCAEESIWFDETLEFQGQLIEAHAIVNDAMPEQLTQVKLKGRKIPKDVFHQKSEDQFWEENRVQLVRVLPMWMPNWHNVCRPGWCIQYQLYDSATDYFFCSMSYCADALTGEVAR